MLGIRTIISHLLALLMAALSLVAASFTMAPRAALGQESAGKPSLRAWSSTAMTPDKVVPISRAGAISLTRRKFAQRAHPGGRLSPCSCLV